MDFDGLKDKVTDAVDDMKDKVTDIVEDVKDKVSGDDAAGKVADAADQAKAQASDAIDQAKNEPPVSGLGWAAAVHPERSRGRMRSVTDLRRWPGLAC